MVAKWIEALTGSLEQKKLYKQNKARMEALPEPYAGTGVPSRAARSHRSVKSPSIVRRVSPSVTPP